MYKRTGVRRRARESTETGEKEQGGEREEGRGQK